MIKTEKFLSKFTNGERITLKLPYYSEKFLDTANAILGRILSRTDRTFLIDTLITILRELVLNAVKANAKRIYFKKIGLDINNPDDYASGIELFRENIVTNLELMEKDLLDSSYRVIISFNPTAQGFELTVTNNTTVHPVEKERIHFRFRESAKYQSFSDAYDRIYDPDEGAGLGIMLIILLTQNAGISRNSFQIIMDKEKTKASLFVPNKLSTSKSISVFRESIIREIDSFPTFPEHVLEIQKLCDNRETPINLIAEKVGTDPTLTADVLKIANSAGFISGKRIKYIQDAIIVIGLRSLKYILTAAATRKILDKRYRRFEQIWEHCNRTAMYARYLAETRGMSSISNEVFISGLLHDIGKIVLLSIEPDLMNSISNLVNTRRIRTSTIIEEITIGISHSTIGEMIARKWNFPEYLIQAIGLHHTPLQTKTKNSDIIQSVYLANMICEIEKDKYSFRFIEGEVLEKFGIKSEDDFIRLREQLSSLNPDQAFS